VIQTLQAAPRKQQGLVLVTSLLMLVVVTLLAVALFRSFGTGEKIAGNTREKQRALNAAETAEQAAEAWLQTGTALAPVACSGAPLTYPASQICTQSMQAQNADPAVIPWSLGGVNYLPPNMVATNTVGAGTYYQAPEFYITFLGSRLVNNFTVSYYQIDAVGFGANANAAAVVESTYSTSATVINNGGQ
jgi:type IV pilus assembly protein PilX